MLAGLAVGCAIMNAVMGKPSAVINSSVDMASTPRQFSKSRFMQPMKPSYRDSTKMSAVSGLTPCAESKAFAKRQKTRLKDLQKRLSKYEAGSAPAVALETTKKRTEARFADYGKSGLLCGADGLPHLIADPGLALKYGHAGDTLVPTIGFLALAGWLGESGRSYLMETRSRDKEIILDV